MGSHLLSSCCCCLRRGGVPVVPTRSRPSWRFSAFSASTRVGHFFPPVPRDRFVFDSAGFPVAAREVLHHGLILPTFDSSARHEDRGAGVVVKNASVLDQSFDRGQSIVHLVPRPPSLSPRVAFARIRPGSAWLVFRERPAFARYILPGSAHE